MLSKTKLTNCINTIYLKASNIRQDKGFSLIAVTWIILLLSIMAVGVLSLGLTSRQTVESVEVDEKQQLLVKSAIDVFMHRYFYDEDQKVYRNGRFELLGHTIDIDVQYQSGKFNLNRSDKTLLSAVFASKGVSSEIAEKIAVAIVDWRDSDDIVQEDGAEKAQYLDQNIKNGPRNGPFESVGELQGVLGMTPSLFACTRSLFTVYSLSNEPNLVYAPTDVRTVLQWAYNNNWSDRSWQNPETVEQQNSVTGIATNLGGQSLLLTIQLDNMIESTFETIVRFGSTAQSDVTYHQLVPLRRTTNVVDTISCD